MPEAISNTDDFVGNAHGNYARVKELLDQYPALVNANASWNETALAAAAQTGQKPIAELLLAHGSDMHTGEGGNPALHGAVLFRRPHMAEWLLAHGAHVNAKNYEGKTPLAVARHNGDTDMADLLRQHGGAE